ncbi:NISCH family protein [Megaselia abdita]
MSLFFKNSKQSSVDIPKYLEINKTVFYEIHVKVKDVEWTLQRRYNEFHELNERLVKDQGLSKQLLPPKKIVGNKNAQFLEQRRTQLEEYIKNLLHFFRLTMPRTFVEFINLNKYDVIYLLQDMSKSICEANKTVQTTIKSYTFTALEVHAISERLCLPCPAFEESDNFDFSHVLDFCNSLENVKITPIKLLNENHLNDYNAVDVPMDRTNIIPKTLNFNLNAFQNLKYLEIYSMPTENITDISFHRPSLKTFTVHNTTTTSLSQILLCDNLHKNSDVFSDTDQWKSLDSIDFSGNLLTSIDRCIILAPKLKTLNLEQNRLKRLENLNDLIFLQKLNLSINCFSEFEDWHLQLGNLISLNLSQNKIKRLSGLRKLLSLQSLDLSCNSIEDLDEITHIAGLPLLENLQLTGNPLARSVDYRPRVLAKFHDRLEEICLDNEKGNSNELDMALVLSALEKSNKSCS